MKEKFADFSLSAIEQAARLMCLAARTAPKAKGLDLLETLIISGEEIKKLAAKMLEIGARENHRTFLRDGENILQAAVVVIIGSKKQTIELKYCGICGFKDCAANRAAGAVCAFNSGDLGIALGSAAAVAADHRLDNRIMYSAGKAAVELGWLGEEIIMAHAIPLSATSKNPFFDRK